MPFTANTVLKGKPATLEVSDTGRVSFASGGNTWEFDQDMKPARFTRDDGNTMTFSQIKDGRGYASVSFSGHASPLAPVDINTSQHLKSFEAVLQTVSDASATPGFPEGVKAKLAAGFEALGQTGRKI